MRESERKCVRETRKKWEVDRIRKLRVNMQVRRKRGKRKEDDQVHIWAHKEKRERKKERKKEKVSEKERERERVAPILIKCSPASSLIALGLRSVTKGI